MEFVRLGFRVGLLILEVLLGLLEGILLLLEQLVLGLVLTCSLVALLLVVRLNRLANEFFGRKLAF